MYPPPLKLIKKTSDESIKIVKHFISRYPNAGITTSKFVSSAYIGCGHHLYFLSDNESPEEIDGLLYQEDAIKHNATILVVDHEFGSISVWKPSS